MTIDGVAECPAPAAEGLVGAYSDTTNDLVEEVKDYVQDPSITSAKILKIINRGMLEIITRLANQGVYLPSLATTGIVHTNPDDMAVSLPADWHGNLHAAVDLTVGRRLNLTTWDQMQPMVNSWPELPGVLHSVAVYAKQLRYWRSVEESHDIKLWYHRVPLPLALSDKPMVLPVEMSSTILLHHACSRIWSMIEQEQNDKKVNTQYHESLYQDALKQIAMEVGPWPTDPIQLRDTMHIDFATIGSWLFYTPVTGESW